MKSDSVFTASKFSPKGLVRTSFREEEENPGRPLTPSFGGSDEIKGAAWGINKRGQNCEKQ